MAASDHRPRDARTTREDADFESQGTRCAAWLFRPTDVADPPVVVMAHGVGGERDWRLPAFAERFTDRGLAALCFDYRRFGDSDGRPRQLVTPRGHVRDWQAAVAHARDLDAVDGSRLALWGTSLAGGHVVATAARETDVDAAVVQVPFTDGLASVRRRRVPDRGAYLRWALAAVGRDLLRAATRRAPHYVPLVDDPGEFAVLTTPGARAAIGALAGDDWPNRCPARALLTIPVYRPVARAGDVTCPTLVVDADADHVVPTSTVDRLVDRLPSVERTTIPGGHWDVYAGETFEAVVAREAEFLASHLLA